MVNKVTLINRVGINLSVPALNNLAEKFYVFSDE